MINIIISGNGKNPIYRQIIEQVKQNLANSELKPGEHLPPVRELAEMLQINLGTAARAYLELKKEGIVGANTRRGTIILEQMKSNQELSFGQRPLNIIINESLIETLRQGYTPEELEESFTLQLARWKFSRETSPTTG